MWIDKVTEIQNARIKQEAYASNLLPSKSM